MDILLKSKNESILYFLKNSQKILKKVVKYPKFIILYFNNFSKKGLSKIKKVCMYLFPLIFLRDFKGKIRDFKGI